MFRKEREAHLSHHLSYLLFEFDASRTIAGGEMRGSEIEFVKLGGLSICVRAYRARAYFRSLKSDKFNMHNNTICDSKV